MQAVGQGLLNPNPDALTAQAGMATEPRVRLLTNLGNRSVILSEMTQGYRRVGMANFS